MPWAAALGQSDSSAKNKQSPDQRCLGMVRSALLWLAIDIFSVHHDELAGFDHLLGILLDGLAVEHRRQRAKLISKKHHRHGAGIVAAIFGIELLPSALEILEVVRVSPAARSLQEGHLNQHLQEIDDGVERLAAEVAGIV